MGDEITLAGYTDVEAALESAALIPPAAPVGIGTGAVAGLRAAMARFSAGEDHVERRAAVVAVIEGLDPSDLRRAAAERTERCRGLSLEQIDGRVPVAVLAAALGVDDGDLDAVVGDVRRVVEVIGRGQDVTPEADAAAERLLARFAGDDRGHGASAVPVVSVLYQAHDATAALLAETWHSRASDTPRRSAVRRTVRTAVADTEVAGTPIPSGATVVLDLASAEHRLELGAGPHRCPGAAVAWALVDGMLDALEVRDQGPGPGT